MISLDYARQSLNAAGIDATDLASPDAAVTALSRADALGRYFSTTWTEPHGILEELFCSTVGDFCEAQKAQAVAYLAGRSTFQDVTRGFIRHMFSSPVEAMNFDACIAELTGQQQAIQKTVEAELEGCLSTGQTLRILGYGADDCSFEHDIGKYAVRGDQAAQYKLYRYDPFAKADPHITDLNRKDLTNLKGAAIDMVTARWVLHHVTPESRWSELRACMRRLRPQGHVVIVEQGDFSRRDNTELEKRLYRFLVMANDVITNAALRPDWFTQTAPEFGANFAVDYLDESDLNDIETGFAHPFRREIRSVIAGKRSGETVIVYHINH